MRLNLLMMQMGMLIVLKVLKMLMVLKVVSRQWRLLPNRARPPASARTARETNAASGYAPAGANPLQ